jgi:hypothetical protein
MSVVKEFENFGPQCGWDNHTFPEQDTSLLDREGLGVCRSLRVATSRRAGGEV